MAQTQARYDQFAEWYEQWIGDAPPLIAAHAGLLPAVTGDRVLDIACGQGRMSRYLASLGADVIGIDISAAMLGKARAAGPDNITYIHADVTRHLAWWDGRPFDGCTCELALMDIDDLAGTLSTVTAVLRPGGWFVASIVHPCFPGNELGRSSWPPGQGYESEGWWTSPDHNPDGVRIRVGATHRKLSTFLNALLDAGLATLTANMAQGWSHGPVGAAVAAWPAVSLVGSYELSHRFDEVLRDVALARHAACHATHVRAYGARCW